MVPAEYVARALQVWRPPLRWPALHTRYPQGMWPAPYYLAPAVRVARPLLPAPARCTARTR